MIFKVLFVYPVFGLIIWALVNPYTNLRWISKHQEKERRKKLIKLSEKPI